MHAFRRFIEDQMAIRDWAAADLVGASKMSAQQVSKLLNDEREMLPRMPESSTIDALARAFGIITLPLIRAAAVQALGVPDVPTFEFTLKDFDDDALLAEVRRRMQRASEQSEAATREWAVSERAKANARHSRNNPATGRRRGRPSGS